MRIAGTEGALHRSICRSMANAAGPLRKEVSHNLISLQASLDQSQDFGVTAMTHVARPFLSFVSLYKQRPLVGFVKTYTNIHTHTHEGLLLWPLHYIFN